MLLVSALFVHMNGDLVDDWASKQVPREQTEPLSLLGFQIVPIQKVEPEVC
jgi:hypothetical protein